MPQYPESIDPFDPESANVFVRAEHLSRYLFAAEFIRKRRLTRVLDAACGSGYGSRELGRHAGAVLGLDRSPVLIERAEHASRAQGMAGMEYRRADLDEGLGFLKDASFDCAVCFETLEHLQRDGALLREFSRVLKNGGALLLSTPKQGYEPLREDGKPANPWHLRLYQRDALEDILVLSGFSVEKALGQPYANAARVRFEDYCRDKGMPREAVPPFFSDAPEAIECYAKVWGWPVEELQEKSNVLILVCKKVR